MDLADFLTFKASGSTSRSLCTVTGDDFINSVKYVHILPYFHGNRSPRADPSLTGMISALIPNTYLHG